MARVTDRRLSRRAFLGASAAGGAALLLGGSQRRPIATPKKQYRTRTLRGSRRRSRSSRR